MLISTAFAAMIQAFKTDPQTVKLFQNIAGANDGQQHKDNHTDITQYFESNKDSILYLTQKNYENLVEALTNNSISNVAASSNPTISLPLSSSSTFSAPPDQSDIYGIQKPESFHNNKGDSDD
jgi:hypothetical protein